MDEPSPTMTAATRRCPTPPLIRRFDRLSLAVKSYRYARRIGEMPPQADRAPTPGGPPTFENPPLQMPDSGRTGSAATLTHTRSASLAECELCRCIQHATQIRAYPKPHCLHDECS